MTPRPTGSDRLRIAFFGTPEPAATCLEVLHADDRLEVCLVVTNPDRRAGRGRALAAPPVKATATRHGLRVTQPDRVGDMAAELVAASLDVAAVVAFGAILPRQVLDTTRLGFVNLHFSLLPRWRGAAPVQHAIRAGDQATGVTAFVLDEGMDTGPVLRQERTDIGPRETAGGLLDRLTILGAPVLADAIGALATGEVPTPQPDDGATLAPRIQPGDVAIDWTTSHLLVDRLCRSADPRPGAHTTFRGERLKVFDARPVRGSGEAGVVVAIERQGAVVACGDGAVRLDAVQPGGRARMSGRDFVNGLRVGVGETIGAMPNRPNGRPE